MACPDVSKACWVSYSAVMAYWAESMVRSALCWAVMVYSASYSDVTVRWVSYWDAMAHSVAYLAGKSKGGSSTAIDSWTSHG